MLPCFPLCLISDPIRIRKHARFKSFGSPRSLTLLLRFATKLIVCGNSPMHNPPPCCQQGAGPVPFPFRHPYGSSPAVSGSTFHPMENTRSPMLLTSPSRTPHGRRTSRPGPAALAPRSRSWESETRAEASMQTPRGFRSQQRGPRAARRPTLDQTAAGDACCPTLENPWTLSQGAPSLPPPTQHLWEATDAMHPSALPRKAAMPTA